MRSGSRSRAPFDMDIPLPVGGLNTAQPVSEIADNELSSAHNMWMDKYGRIETRPGFTKVTSTGTSNQITGGFYSTVENENLIASNGILYSLNTATGALTNKGALSGTDKVDMCDYNDGVAIASGGTVQKYQGGTLSTLVGDDTAVPSDIKFVEAFMRRLWACGDQHISWTGAETWTDWGGTGLTGGQLYVEKNDGSSITGLSLLDGEPIIFKGGYNKRQSIHHVTGTIPTEFSVLPISTGVSCVEGHGIDSIQGDIVFPGIGGIFSLSMIRDFENPRSFPLSLKINPTYITYTPLWGTYDGKRGMYFLVTTGYLFVWHVGSKSWNVWPIKAFTPRVIWMGDSDNLYIGAEDGHVYKFDTGVYTDAGEVYTCDMATKAFKPKSGSVDKLFKWFYIDYVPLGEGGITVNYRSDYGQSTEHSSFIGVSASSITGWDGSFAWDTSGIGWDMVGYETKRQRMNFRASNIQFQVVSSAPLRLISWGLSGSILGRSKRKWS